MQNANRRLPSPAIVISVAALVVAMSGIAWAHGKISTNNIERHAVTTPKLDSRAVKGGKIQSQAVKGGKIRPGAVKTEKIENDAVTGDKVNESTLGPVPSAVVADTGNPLAFARVDGDGTIDDPNAKNLASANASNPEAGTYCIDVDYPVVHAQATGMAQASGDDIVMVEVAATGNDLEPCPASAEVEVRIFDLGDDGLENDSFYIALW